jgi:hypothetical protein
MKIFTFLALICLALPAAAQDSNHGHKFEQLGTMLPTPNSFRTASGAPGYKYWQQKADYDINVTLDDDKQTITGSEVITYFNNSPDELTYLWLQLDQNQQAKTSDSYATATSKITDKMTIKDFQKIVGYNFEGGYNIKSVKETDGKNLPYTINKTMMRVELPRPLRQGKSFSFSIAWSYNINDRMLVGGRSGYEYFAEDKNYVYTIAQFFPRMAVYDDYNGWQNKQFLGTGEFTLPFGDYKVNITVPSDHIMGATGILQNPAEVLSKTAFDRFEKSKTASKPVIIVSQEEAEKKEQGHETAKKTWVFKAENVRDFAFATSRKFIWDAMGIDINGKKIMAMSLYPKEGNPLWGQYSTRVVAHTLKTYSKYTIDYPYPVAYSVHADQLGMEYPMICFNFGRPEKDGTYSDRIKYGMISVVIHEVGHNFFPMIINSDERQWTWMDEGLNSFVQFLTEQEWDRNYPSRRGHAVDIVPYMKSSKDIQEPIMTNSEQIIQLGNNAYGKAATSLNMLRETIMGRPLFDYAFKEYARRWAFKHPTPADLFRTLEDASAVDLDWFWRGWFYSTDNTEISMEDVNYYRINSKNPAIEKQFRKNEKDKIKNITRELNKKDIPKTAVESDDALKDFYNSYDEFEVTDEDNKDFGSFQANLSDDEKGLMAKGWNFYEIKFKNNGGLVMPLILEFTFKDDTKEIVRIPAEIWRYNEKEITKVFALEKEVTQIILDPYQETADVDTENNYFPRQQSLSKFDLFKAKTLPSPNPMQKNKKP